LIVLDTTILLYAVGAEHPNREPSRRVVAAITEGRVAASTTVEVIQEFGHVYSRRRDRRAAVVVARRYAALLTPLLSATSEDLEDGLRIYERHPALGCFDSVLAACAIRADAEVFVSTDRGFGNVRGLRHLDPASEAIVTVLGE
jgi:predicted nucleic acid-binding protein